MIYRVSMPGWHFPELAKGVAHKPLPSQAQGLATRKAVSKNCTLPKRCRTQRQRGSSRSLSRFDSG